MANCLDPAHTPEYLRGMEKSTPKRTPFERANTEVSQEAEDIFRPRSLTPRKRRAIEAYVRHGTYTAAAKASGMASSTVKKMVEEDADARKMIGHMIDQAAAITGITLERVLQEYGRLAFSDVGEIVDLLRAAGEDSDVALEMLAELPASVTAAIGEIQITRKLEHDKDGGEFASGTMKIKLYSKQSALSDLGRMLSVFDDKLTIDDSSGFGQRLKQAVEKIEGMTAPKETDDGE